MNDEFYDIDFFDAYLNNDLNPGDKAEFEMRLASEKDFSAEFELYRTSITLVKTEGFKKEVRNVLDKKTRSNTRYFWYSGIAASVLIAAIFYFPKSDPNPTDLFTSYYEPYPSIKTLRSSAEGLSGFRKYSEGKYKEAILDLEGQKAPSDTVHFYLALSYLSTDEPEQAKRLLSNIELSSTFDQHMRWYKGLAHLTLQETDSAKFLLQEIDLSEFKFKEAQTLLDLLN